MKAKKTAAETRQTRTTKQPKRIVTKKRALIVIVLLLTVGIVLLSVFENRRHHQLVQSVDSLKQSLESQGFRNIERKDGCGRTQVKYGAGGKVCSVSLNINTSVDSTSEADGHLKRFAKSIAMTGEFKVVNPLSDSAIDKRSGLGIVYASFLDYRTGRLCSASSSYTSLKNNIRLSFRCDDSSWFTKTYRNGQFF